MNPLYKLWLCLTGWTRLSGKEYYLEHTGKCIGSARFCRDTCCPNIEWDKCELIKGPCWVRLNKHKRYEIIEEEE